MSEETTPLRGGNGGNGGNGITNLIKNLEESIQSYYQTLKKSDVIADRNFKDLGTRLTALEESNRQLYPVMREYVELQNRPCWLVRIIQELIEYMGQCCS